MNEPWNWTEADLLKIVAANDKEDRHLDYKACDSLRKNDDGKKRELAKDVSAFANSDGGTIVYGIREVGADKRLAMDSGYDPADIPPEWIEQVVMGRVRPALRGLRVNPVTLASGKVAYVVYVPQTTNGPHQAPDGKYYKRIERTSEFMQDYEIRDVMSRGTVPDLSAILAFDDLETPIVRPGKPYGYVDSPSISIYVKLINRSNTPCSYAHVDVFLPRPLARAAHDASFTEDATPLFLMVGTERIEFLRYYRAIMSPHSPPIIEGVVCTSPGRVVLQYPIALSDDRQPIGWRIRAAGMVERQGWSHLVVKGNVLTFENMVEPVMRPAEPTSV